MKKNIKPLGDGYRYLWDDLTLSWDRITNGDEAIAMSDWAFTPSTQNKGVHIRPKFDYENTPNSSLLIGKNEAIRPDDTLWTRQQVEKANNTRTWLSDAADVSHSIGEAAMIASMFAAPELEPAMTNVAKNLMWSNPNSLLSRNIRTSFFNRKVPFEYNWYDPNNFIPYLEGGVNTIIGRSIKPNKIPIPKNTPGAKADMIRNRYAAWGKYLGVDDNLPLYDSSTGENIGPYIRNSDGTFNVALTPALRQNLIDDLINTGGKQLYDHALYNHGGMGYKVVINDGPNKDAFPAILEYSDIWDLQPFREIHILPKKIQEFEASLALPAGAKPFELRGSIALDDVNTQELLKNITHAPSYEKINYGTSQNMDVVYGLLGGTAVTPLTYYGGKKLINYLSNNINEK